jgi:hypothetical protein
MYEPEINEIKTDIAAMQRIFQNTIQLLSMRLADLEKKINSALPTDNTRIASATNHENKIVPASNKK